MTALVQDMTGAAMTRDRPRQGLTAETYGDLASVEPLWRQLEADPAVLATPYQRFDWIAAYMRVGHGADASERGGTLRVMVMRDGAGRPRMLMPLKVSARRGLRIARVVGGKHANFHMPLFASREAAAIRPEDMFAALVLAGRAAGIDAYAFDHQPRFWDGAANPLSAKGFPCASDAYGLLLGPDPEGTVRRAYSGDARKKLRAKERKLVEALGPVAYGRATSPEAIAAALEAFYVQKAARSAAMGISDVYAHSAVQRFLSAGTAVEAGADTAPIEVHTLVATGNGRTLATFGGAVDGKRFSGMWTSFDPDPELARFSPGELLLHHLVRQQTEAGRRAFDLGVGEARYKASICDETIELVKAIVPVTARGHLFALAAVGAGRAKRRIKRSPRLWAALQALRRTRIG